jgi:hypothetical protein
MVALNTIRRIEVQATSSGVQETTAKLDALSRAQTTVAQTAEGMAVKTESSSRRQLSAAGAYDRLRTSIDDSFRASQRLASGQATIDRAFQQGVISAQEQAHALQLLQARYASVGAANDNLGQAVSGSMGLARHELINLSRQAQDVAVSLAGGQSPLTVLFQQGSQIGDVFATSNGTVTGFFKQVTGSLSGFLTAGRVAFGGVALAITGAGMALNSYLDSQQKVQMSLLGAGRASGQSVSSISAVAQSSSSLTGLSVTEARAFASELAATGKIGRDNLEPLVRIGHDIATIFGVNAADAAKMLGKAFADPAQGAEQLNERLGFLDGAMQRQIQNLVAQNRVWEAQRVLQQAVESSLVGVSEATSTTTKFWTALGNAASNTWDKIGAGLSRVTGIGLKLGLDEQLKVAQDRLDSFKKDLETAQEFAKSIGPGAKGSETGYDAAVAGVQKYTAEVERLTASLKKNSEATQNVAAAQASLRVSNAVFAQLPEVAQRQSLTDQAAIGGSVAEDPALQRSLGISQQQADRMRAITSQVKADYKTTAEEIQTSAKIALDSVTAFSPAAKALVAAREATERYRAAGGLDPSEKARIAQDAYNLSLKQSAVAISEAARARELAANQGVTAAQLEVDLIGKTIGQQTELRANLQARQQLEQQASQNRTLVNGQLNAQDQAELERLQKINAEHGKRAQLAAVKSVQNDIDFGRKTAFLSAEDVQIAQQLRTIYGNDVPAALQSAEAEAIRLNNSFKSINDTIRDAAQSLTKDFVSGLVSGKSVMSSLGDAATNLSAKLTDKAITSLFSGDLVGAAVSGIGALVSGLFGNNQKKREQEEKDAKAAMERMIQYQQRATMARLDTSNREGSLAAQEAQFQAERLQEAQNGNRALDALLTAQNAERVALQKQWDDKEIAAAKAKQEAIDARVLSSQDRLFAALNDNTTLEGQLAAADRQYARERLDEMKSGGEALLDLVAAQEAERADIVKKYNQDLLVFVQGVAKTIRDYLQGLKTGGNSILSPQQQLAAAQANFQDQLAKANAGDRDALSGITQVAQTLLDQAKSYYASSDGYTAIFNQVTAALQGVANIGAGTVSDADRIVAAVNESKTATTGTITTTSLQEQSLLNAMNLVLGAINTLADRFVNAINGLGALTSTIGSNQSYWLAQIYAATAKSAANSGGSFWSWLGFQQGGLIPGYADGGIVGNGLYGVDSVLARYAGGGSIGLAGGEYVMPADRTSMFKPQLDAMRSGAWANDNAAPAGFDWQALARALKQVSDGSDANLAAKIDQLIEAINEMPSKNAAATRRLLDGIKQRAG